MLKLYENIKRYRKAAGFTQEEMARRTGYTDRSSIARIEKGEIDLPQSKIKQFAEAFGVSPGELMGWDETPAEELQNMGSLAAQLLLQPDAMEVMRKYMAMEESDRQAVRDFMALGDADRYALRLVMASMAQKKTDAGASVVKTEKCAEKSDCNV